MDEHEPNRYDNLAKHSKFFCFFFKIYKLGKAFNDLTHQQIFFYTKPLIIFNYVGCRKCRLLLYISIIGLIYDYLV